MESAPNTDEKTCTICDAEFDASDVDDAESTCHCPACASFERARRPPLRSH